MADEKKIEAGDVVTLKSGGPTMTVCRIVTDDEDEAVSAYCSWFTEGHPYDGEFPLVALKRVQA